MTVKRPVEYKRGDHLRAETINYIGRTLDRPVYANEGFASAEAAVFASKLGSRYDLHGRCSIAAPARSIFFLSTGSVSAEPYPNIQVKRPDSSFAPVLFTNGEVATDTNPFVLIPIGMYEPVILQGATGTDAPLVGQEAGPKDGVFTLNKSGQGVRVLAKLAANDYLCIRSGTAASSSSGAWVVASLDVDVDETSSIYSIPATVTEVHGIDPLIATVGSSILVDNLMKFYGSEDTLFVALMRQLSTPPPPAPPNRFLIIAMPCTDVGTGGGGTGGGGTGGGGTGGGGTGGGGGEG